MTKNVSYQDLVKCLRKKLFRTKSPNQTCKWSTLSRFDTLEHVSSLTGDEGLQAKSRILTFCVRLTTCKFTQKHKAKNMNKAT